MHNIFQVFEGPSYGSPRQNRSQSGIMFGKPVVNGARLAVEQILYKLAAGVAADQVIEDHPHLTEAHIRAAKAFAAD
ncbi:MAG TPA: DUF433 domain-containing protein [Gammaproteobacteria bacterium]|nr:DUF433 domain-containing protein [Gammaproteobacteria bacterium]